MGDIATRAKELGFETSSEPIQTGDTYLAERNCGPKLLTCKEVDNDNRWIVPVESDYVFDICECIKIVS